MSQGARGLDEEAQEGLADPPVRAHVALVELAGEIAARDSTRISTRERAIEGLRAIAQLEEYVAAAIDESGYYGRMSEALRLSALDRRSAAARLDSLPGRSPLRSA